MSSMAAGQRPMIRCPVFWRSVLKQGWSFRLETSSFDLPFFVELDHANVVGRVEINEDGVAMVDNI